MEKSTERGPVLTIFAILFSLLAISNIMKPLSRGRGHFVFLGSQTSGIENAILGPAFGIFLAIYALGIWRQKRWAVTMAWAYAAYVIINVSLFTMKTPEKWPGLVAAIVYTAVGVGVPLASAIVLTRRRPELT